MNTSALKFSFKEVVDECEAFKSYAREFLDLATISSIDEARASLLSIQKRKRNGSTRWEIPEAQPVRTRWSEGEWQQGGALTRRIRAEFSFVWEVTPIVIRKSIPCREFQLGGLASTVVTLVNEIDGETFDLARWAVEIGDDQSPGTHFHVQVKGPCASCACERPFFPGWLDIPRLPALLMSPFLVIEYALGELFQGKWTGHAMSETSHASRWRSIHEDRLKRFFHWQLRCIGNGSGSPLMKLKTTKPDADLLTSKVQH